MRTYTSSSVKVFKIVIKVNHTAGKFRQRCELIVTGRERLVKNS